MTTWRVVVGDARTRLAELPAANVQTCITSPPYWGLRDYGTATWDGGDQACAHRVGGQVQDSKAPGAIVTGQRPGVDASRCKDCGARRIDNQLGLESTPDAYVAALVNVFREVRRVLKDDGTVWCNLGDSYATGTSTPSKPSADNDVGYWNNADKIGRTRIDGREFGLKPKDLVGIPWMVAFALRADGWYLRSDIIWAKPNPMPESVTDRPTKAHEYIFLLSKSQRYYYDSEAITDLAVSTGPPRRDAGGTDGYVDFGMSSGRAGNRDDGTRNKRSVWTVTTQPYPDAHFATYPEKLIEPCILAGSAIGETVLDPFTGSGTTGAVAIRHQRNFIGCELNPAYVALARRRIGEVAPLFAEEVA